MQQVFARQAIPMAWDYAEVNPFSESTGNWMAMVDWTWKALETVPASAFGKVQQADAQNQTYSVHKVVSTDPPYYDNIGYADLSDFFYVWLRRSLKPVFPDLFATLAVPKAEELVATPYRHGSKAKGGGILPRRHDAGDAPARRAGAPGLSGHHLLCLQAGRERRRLRARQYRLGDLS